MYRLHKDIDEGREDAASDRMDRKRFWTREMHMDKLRSKSSQQKSCVELAKNVRMALLDKRYALDVVEKRQHQKCLDILQSSIKVATMQDMSERLESVSRQLGLKFVQSPSGHELFISSEMFYLEVVLAERGVSDVKVHHEGKVEQQSCEELILALGENNFTDFTNQLEGFRSIYQLNADKVVKARAFTALQSLEHDLSTQWQLKPFVKDANHVIHVSPIGLLQRRYGGHAMKLTYLVSPYELIDPTKLDIEPFEIEHVISKNLGCSVTVCIESSQVRTLPIAPLCSLNRSGKGSASYAPFSSQNTAIMPASFVLRLKEPMPMCTELVEQILNITEINCGNAKCSQPLLSLIANHFSLGDLSAQNNAPLFVSLPDQTHCYYMNDSRNLRGTIVTAIPFTHPAHVAQIIPILRQQALFNTLIGSCIRPKSRQDIADMVMLEVSPLNWTHISIALEHPFSESMATAEIDLSDISKLRCEIFSSAMPAHEGGESASELTSRVLNRSWSLPITMRAILRYWEQQFARRANHYNGLENFNLPLGAGDPGGRSGSSGSALGERDKEPADHAMMPSSTHPHQGIFLSETLMSASSFAGFAPDAATPALTNVELTNILTGSGSEKPKRVKRKGCDEAWKSAKRKPGDDELMDASSCDSTSRSTPLSQDTEIQTPNSALGFHSDLELSALDADFDPDELGDVEELLAGKKDKSPIACDFDSNKLVSPSVSITPINTATQLALNAPQPNLDRRSSIEIFPITGGNTQLSSSVTITPIAQKTDKERAQAEMKAGKRVDDKARLEKKKKRKREGSPMGPPEKIPNKADALPKPLGVSVKPTESPPHSPNMARKFSPSPTHNRTLSGKLSPNLIKATMKTHSPKHSPAHVPSSPKHMMATIGSPKSSPKHPSTSGSGKPSMSTLKNAASSPSSKSDAKKSGGCKEAVRDKEKKTGGGYASTLKTSKSYIKVKPLDLNSIVEAPAGHLDVDAISPGLGIDLTKATSSLNQIRNRKSGCLSAIVDKLAKAQNCDITAELVGKPKERGPVVAPNKTDAAIMAKSSTSKQQGQETKNSEYVLKHSSDCMKLTINKTRTREPCSKAIKSGAAGNASLSTMTGSPKNHTGLKPGVNSGPASKKPQPGTAKPSLVSPCATYPPSSVKPFAKSSSSGSLKLQTAATNLGKKMLNVYGPKNTIDANRIKERPKLSKSSSEKSIFSKAEKGKASPTQETENLNLNFPTKKQFDKSFQIPKLSARTGEDKKPKTTENNVASRDKLLDSLSKYPTPLPTSKLFDTSMEAKIRNTMNSVNITNSLTITTTSPLYPSSISPKEREAPHTASASEDSKKPKEDAAGFSKTLPISASNAPSKPFLANKQDVLSQANRSIDLTSKFIAPAPKMEETKVDKRDTEMIALVEFSSAVQSQATEKKRVTDMSATFPPASPSVSVHIVKSPAPSPLVAPSPHSAASPSITDDELMDEALIGLGK